MMEVRFARYVQRALLQKRVRDEAMKTRSLRSCGVLVRQLRARGKRARRARPQLRHVGAHQRPCVFGWEGVRVQPLQFGEITGDNR